MRFGLYFVDYSSPNRSRYPKRSARWYADYVLSHPSGPLDVDAVGPASLVSSLDSGSDWSPLSSLWELFGNPEKFFLFGHYFLAP
jgi:hypothetical protein